MEHEAVARKLSNHQRRFLITLIDGPIPFFAAAKGGATALRAAMFRKELIRFCNENGHHCGRKFIALTEDGRHTLGYVLAEYAETLMKAEIASFEFYEYLTHIADDKLHEHTKHLAPA